MAAAWQAVREAEAVPVQRLMKQGLRTIDVRPALVAARSSTRGPGRRARADGGQRDAAVRPAEILVALRELGGLAAGDPARATRLAQGPLGEEGAVGDPLDADRQAVTTVG